MTTAATDVVLPDPLLAGAIEIARAAAVDDAGADAVGDHLATVGEDERVVAHAFACLLPAYVGWQWTVTLVRAPESDDVTVVDVVLMAGADAIVAPAWLPWSERVQPGDLGPGDLLPSARDDRRLVAGLSGSDDLEGVESLSPLSPSQWEIGLGRVRVLSADGRDDAAIRWQSGDFGPATAMARQAPHECATCGFLLTIGGPVSQLFGVCANEMSPADGRVVSLAYGCGAHSEVEPEPEPEPLPSVDELDVDILVIADAEDAASEPEAVVSDSPESHQPESDEPTATATAD